MKAKKQKSGKWRCVVYDGRDDTGKRIYKSITADTKRAAESEASLWQATREIRAAEAEAERLRAHIPTLYKAIDMFIDTCRAQKYSPSTIPTYLKYQRNAYPTIIDKKIDEITLMDVQLLVDTRAADHGPKTIRNELTFLRSVLRRYRPELNLDGIVIAKKRKKAKRVFKQSWAREILDYTRENLRTDMYLYTSFIIALGCRPSEVYSLRWGDLSARPIIRIGPDGRRYRIGTVQIDSASVCGEDGQYHEKEPKTDAGLRCLTVSWSFFEDLYRARPRGADQDPVVLLKPVYIPRNWARVRRALDLPGDMRFYDLRHFFATSAKSAGASDEELAAAMGHSTPVFSHDVYVEIFAEEQQRTSFKMADATDKLYEATTDPAEISLAK